MCTTGLAGLGLGASRWLTQCINFFISSPPLLLALAPYVVIMYRVSGIIFSSPAPSWKPFLILHIGLISAPSLRRGLWVWLYMHYSPSSSYISGWFVHSGESDMRAPLGVLAPCTSGCVLSLPSGSWWDWWVTLIIIIIIFLTYYLVALFGLVLCPWPVP